MNSDDIRRLYAKLSNVSYMYYFKQIYIPIDGYNLFHALSDINSVVLVNNQKGEIVLSIRGTDFRNTQDIADDILVLKNNIEISERFKYLSNKITEISNLKQSLNYSFTVCGHSLGGILAFELIKKFHTIIDNAYLYNIGFGPYQFVEALTRSLGCKVINSKQCKIEKELKRKIHIFNVKWDIISALSAVHPSSSFINRVQGNSHSLDNLVAGSWEEYLNNSV